MTENPIVVFFRQSETKIRLPIAFPSHGVSSFNPTEENGEASLIVLNDEGKVTKLQHSNQNRQSYLGFFWHNETDEKKKELEHYGQPVPLEGFSHIPGNRIFDSIKAILENEGNVEQFVEEGRRLLVQFDLEELAALITYLALVPEGRRPEEQAYSRYNTILGRCNPDDKILIGDLVLNRQFIKAVEALETIVGRDS